MKKLICVLLMAAMLGLTALGLTGCGDKLPFPGYPNPVATIYLSDNSSMRFELFLQDAPNTVANFVELAQNGFYNGLGFHRIVPGVLIQSGSPNSGRTGKAEHTIQGEFALNGIENNVSHTRGTISMSRLGDGEENPSQEQMDSASSQFFIMQGSYPEFNGKHAAFGRAMDQASLAVIDRIASYPVDESDRPVESPPRIVRITVETYGYKYEAHKFLPEDAEEENTENKDQ